MKSISASELVNKNKNINVIDVRSKLETFLGKKVPGSKNIPMGKMMSHPEKFLDKAVEYYIVCQSGGRSMQVCQSLRVKGYKVINVTGGMNAY
ncbi:MAG: rhodanese-like domain-containing protein [Turicibacter sp.]